jgi:hypothetical protein
MWSDNPAADWDRFCEEQEREYQNYIYGKTCKDCIHFRDPEDSGYKGTGIGYCKVNDDFGEASYLVSDSECQEFEDC